MPSRWGTDSLRFEWSGWLMDSSRSVVCSHEARSQRMLGVPMRRLPPREGMVLLNRAVSSNLLATDM